MQRPPTSDHRRTRQSYPKDEDRKDKGWKDVRVPLHPHHLLMSALRSAVIWMRSHTTSESNKCFQWFGNRWLSEVPAAGIGLDVSKWLDTCLSCWFLGLVLFPRLDFWMQQAAREPSIPLDQREGTDEARPTHSPPAAPSLLSPCTLSFSHSFPANGEEAFSKPPTLYSLVFFS